ncbi:sigma-54 interaction domain-containing protein [Gracilinema caldarium]|uniref:PAS modulated sigma54 specific transcriptional regulator, Fis family n=1 Tax=Gracilinema caldarium (strain ATCC 51460 / DSM 7334 / H1) TaxID=744872 RepID=F8EXB8_GRAC1|nr:sigma-54-dependent Fis family transcriptional regulator [Gracilinema caldarium]AEJ18861.1 PAS modulated sigma54 specific transcriptional regulator, Fis family [Gracilinema caldarium DSM 7334]
MTDIILESISDGVFTIDLEWHITSFNRAAENIIGIKRNEAIGKLCYEVFKSNMCESRCPLRKTMQSGKPVINVEGFCINPAGERIPISVSTALLKDQAGHVIGGAETFRDLRELEELKQQLVSDPLKGELTSRSPAMHPILEMLPTVADSSAVILIEGETGTGKEVTARAIHRMSPQAQGPFVAVNCGALPDTLLESELFGYKKGAFTGADRDKIGRFKMADGGALFLDEIGEISQAMQVKLLRVLQEGVYERLGSTTSERSRARIICATNRNLKQMVEEGRFRRDLFYRINVITLSLPPLRERKEDIPGLADYFLRKYRIKMGKKIQGFTEDVYEAFYAYPWPGNIRELENVVERAVVLCSGERITLSCLPEELVHWNVQAARALTLLPKPAGAPGFSPILPHHHEAPEVPHEERFHQTAAQAETDLIRKTLAQNGNNRTLTARQLGIHRATLYRKMKQYGIELDESGV